MSSAIIKPSALRDSHESVRQGDSQAGPTASVSKQKRWRQGRFLELYGWTGLLMIAMFLLSALWMAMLAVIQQAPTYVANVLMDTADLDDGDLWIFTRADDPIAWTSTIFLACVAVSYVWLIGLMVRQSCVVVSPGRTATQAQVAPNTVTPFETPTPDPGTTVSRSSARRKYWKWVGGRIKAFAIRTRLHDNPLFSLPKLVLQTVTLFTMLADGIPPPIILTYSSLLMINWTISCYRHTGQRDDPQLVKSRIFFSFDTFFAVFAPLQVLVYACANFTFDRAEFATRVETISPGNFDRIARLFVDPTQISLFRIAFQSLQLTMWPNLFIKVLLNVFAVMKWYRIVVDLSTETHPEPIGSSHGRVGKSVRCLVFLGTGSVIFVYTVVAIVSTGQVCQAYQHCTVPSYQWSVGSRSCACAVFVDRQIKFASLAEWENPSDTSENLALLAAAGRLKVVQIINRRLTTLPEELRSCTDLEHLILFYTLTTTIPDWASGFTKLKYLHIEGDPTRATLTHLPANLFMHMPFLSLIHFGDLGKLTAIPDLSHLVRLKYLVLAILSSVTEVPGLDALTNLEQLTILSVGRLESLPSLHKLSKLMSVVTFGLGPMCCNGFMTGNCDLSQPACANHQVCATTTLSLAEPTLVEVQTACMFPTFPAFRPTVASADLACGGVAYKQCENNGSPGICYPVRFQVVWCDFDPTLEAMRRLQIERGVGHPCDPVVEKWLGCTAANK